MRTPKKLWLVGLLAVIAALAIPALARNIFFAPQGPVSDPVPVTKNGIGPCTADFVVTDDSGKGIYNAKIEIMIRYGGLGLRRLDSVVGTNSDGKARMEGLPDQIKKTAEFQVTYGTQSKTLVYDPVADCHPTHDVLFSK